MAKEMEQLALIGDDGKMISKDDFLRSAAEVYDELADTAKFQGIEPTAFDLISNPDAQIDVQGVLETYMFSDRSIFLTEEIEQSHANSIFEVIKFWNDMDKMDDIPVEQREPIKIYINTPGGDLDAVFSIISSIKISKTPVHTITIGTGYSGGFFIGICGHKRFGYPYSSYLFHEGSVMEFGDAHKFFSGTDFRKKQLNTLKYLVLDNTKITDEEYKERRNDDWYMNPADAIKYGVIDEIIDKF